MIHRSVERIIDSVLDDLAGLTARHLFELSHGEAGWRHAWSLLDVAD